MNILGVSSFYHDSAAALLKDGIVVAAAEEERFNRVKHSSQFPQEAIAFCLKNQDLTINEIDYLAYYEKPLLRFERVLDSIIRTYPFSLELFLKGIPDWLGEKIKVESHIRKKLGYKGKIVFIPHHLSHAAASYFASGYKKAAILTVDGVGEYQTVGLWQSIGNSIIPLKKISFPHSLGLLYSTFTAFLGFMINEGEYKLMGLSAYGKPRYLNQMLKTVEVKEDGSFRLNMNYFNFHKEYKMWNKKFEDLFGTPRLPNEPFNQKHKDLAASIQELTERMYFKMLNHLYELTSYKDLCISGGVALNAAANGKIYKKTPFQNIYIIGPAGDGGSALGAAYFTYYNLLNGSRKSKGLANLFLGTAYSSEKIEEILKKKGLKYQKYLNKTKLVEDTAKLLLKNNVVGWFQGRMEYGPRALGSRSILASPKDKNMREKVGRIKNREQFRPFACSILKEKVHEYFEVPQKNHASSFMNFCFKAKDDKVRDIIAVVHVDGTSRIQTVAETEGIYFRLIQKFYTLSGIPCLLNTSFNRAGEPIVENPQQAVDVFLKSSLDLLIIENFIVQNDLMDNQ